MALRSLLLGVLLTACSLAAGESLPPTATTLRVVPGTTVPTISRELQPVASPQSAETISPTADTCQSNGAQRTQHEINAEISYEMHTASVEQRTRLINHFNEPLPQIVFHVEPNRLPDVFTLDDLTADQPLTDYELTGRRLTLNLEQPLEPGCPLAVEMAFTLRIPSAQGGIAGFGGYLGYSDRQLNLGHWLPVLAVWQGGDWITRDVFAVGEQFVNEPADWDVTLNVTDAPESLTVAAPGEVDQPNDNTWHIVHDDARDFAVSMSPMFRVQRRSLDPRVTVEVYHFDNAVVDTPQGQVNGAVHALDAAVASLSMYSDLFGAYPDSRLVIVQGDFPDGMEFTGLVFVGDAWFRTFPGTPQSYLYIITVHEVAHQWWYARVGSDQALTPWLDEALATYSEYIFYEEMYPDLKDWWWAFRVETFVPAGYTGRPVDSSIYNFASARDYINAVYLRGAAMLHRLREDMGTQAFFDWLRRYADTGAGGVASPDRFWALLTPEQLDTTATTRRAYLGSP